MSARLSKDIISSLCYSEYWSKPIEEWGVTDWDMFYIKKVPEANKHDSHSSLGTELATLLELLPEKEPQYQHASRMKQRLKVKIPINVKQKMENLTKSEVNKRVNMRNLENIAITTGISAGIRHFETNQAISGIVQASNHSNPDSDNKTERANNSNLDFDQVVSEIKQASNQRTNDFTTQTYDKEDLKTNDANIDEIIVEKISDLLFLNLNLEEIWMKVTDRLKKGNLRVQSIESRIVDLSNWTKVDWNRILKTSDYAQLFNRSRKELCKEKIDKEVQGLLHDGCEVVKRSNIMERQIHNIKIRGCITNCWNYRIFVKVNVLVMQHRERDYIVKILSPIMGFIFEEFDIGTFELNWIEKDSRSVTSRKRKYINSEYVKLNPPSKLMDLIISLRSYKVELLVLEAGNTEGPMDDTKFREDHSKIKVVMKDCIDAFWSNLHFKKKELEEVFVMGIQITGTKWSVYSLTYDSSKNFYFFVEMATLTLPTTLSDMGDLLHGFLKNLLALRHTHIDLVAKIRKFTQKRFSTPSPPSSPLHKTTETPSKKQKLKEDPFYILDKLY
ncbi:1231_t:CDS:10 [Diversispora eburnea]|uniref:1231_t:CDS:1 n=1 Tax=Diversispora eburnea TaxID=1213867 RepID=A0A9N9CXU3_9GLOM|nr:1231_t:CDS:10 [Diversispora eburnea]